ncbi:MAG: hypothetical protein ACOY9D_05700 [Pseudomonadota bacterium]
MRLTEDRKAIVDALTEDELAYEVKRGRASRFQRELYDYAQTRLESSQQAKQEAHDREHLKVAKQTKDVNKWGVSVTAIGVVVAVAVALSQCVMKQ